MTQQDLIARTERWLVDVKQMPAEPFPRARRAAFYLGMQLEELSEKLEVVLGGESFAVGHLANLASAFKLGQFDAKLDAAMTSRAKDLLDADMDLIFVSVGAARAQGADATGAYEAVITANEAKRWPDGEYHLAPDTGKVLKPEGWAAPDLEPYVHQLLKPEGAAQ